MILSFAAAKKITDKVLSLSRADSAVVTLSGTEHGNIRFALNSVTTSGHRDDATLSIESDLGKRSGSVTVNELDDASILAAVRKSEEIARLAPENPEFMPPLGRQAYVEGRGYSEETAKAQPHTLAALCRPGLQTAEKNKVAAAGYL